LEFSTETDMSLAIILKLKLSGDKHRIIKWWWTLRLRPNSLIILGKKTI